MQIQRQQHAVLASAKHFLRAALLIYGERVLLFADKQMSCQWNAAFSLRALCLTHFGELIYYAIDTPVPIDTLD